MVSFYLPGLLHGIGMHAGIFTAGASPAMSVADCWEKIRRIRRRFSKGSKWVLFPVQPENAAVQKPVSTKALDLNAQALQVLVQHYGPNPVHIKPLEKEASHAYLKHQPCVA